MTFAPSRGALGFAAALAVASLLLTSSGCRYLETLRGEGFSNTRQAVSGSVRPGTQDAKPSNFFTDKRSDEIEKNLGGF